MIDGFQAIQTHYVGPSNVKPGRVVAKASAGRVIVEWDHELNIDDNHKVAAMKLAAKFKWESTWVSGCLADGSFVHVQFGEA